MDEYNKPYYIGQGKGNRIDGKHTNVVKPPKHRRVFLKQNLTKEESLIHERYMISVLGRKCNNTGILVNLQEGVITQDLNEYYKEHYHKQKEYYSIKNKEYREKNKEELKEYSRQYFQKNKEKKNRQQRERRRLRKLQNQDT
jgi:hypothetical protein